MKSLFFVIGFFAILMLTSCGPLVGVRIGHDPHRYYGARPYYDPRPFYNPYYYSGSNAWGRPHHRSYYRHR